MRHLAFLLLLAVSLHADAGLREPPTVSPTVVPGAPAGYTVNDFTIDFDQRFFGHQMVVRLTQGSIYQDPLGGSTAPTAAGIGVVPTLAADTFVTVGGLTAETSTDVFIPGKSTEFREVPPYVPPVASPGTPLFGTDQIDIAWYAAPGNVIPQGDDFPIARLTLSDDAAGHVYLNSSVMNDVYNQESERYTWEFNGGGASWNLIDSTIDPYEPVDPVDPADRFTPVDPVVPAIPANPVYARATLQYADDLVVNDLKIDFKGQLFGQQMVIDLDSGSIYQDALGGETPPNSAFFPVAPSLEHDSFLTMGGLTSGTSNDVLVVGQSTELGLRNPSKIFSTDGVDVAWAPAPGVVIEDGVDFPIARLTLTPDASGTIYLYSNAGGQATVVVAPITNGIIGGYIPEPASAAILIGAIASTGAIATRRGART